jgi:Icc-related predicted phosphoesterase
VRILAFSDLHGHAFHEAERLVALHRPDWLVLCGDMLPDFNQRPEANRTEAQRSFWRDHRGAFMRQGTVTTFLHGNHELPGFRAEGMDAVPRDLAGRLVRLEGVPGDSGPFSFARGRPDSQLEAELTDQLSRAPSPVIYISHAPPLGSCDKTYRGDHIGHRPLLMHLKARDWPRALVLCGHVHQSFGIDSPGLSTIINVATGYALLEWDEHQTRVLEMARLTTGGNYWDSP